MAGKTSWTTVPRLSDMNPFRSNGGTNNRSHRFIPPKLSEIEVPSVPAVSTLEGLVAFDLNTLRERAKHPLSAGLPINSATNPSDKALYTNVLPEYGASTHQSSEDKTEFLDDKNPNLGWKLHLNVSPKNVIEVSRYLVENGYDHKYLSGGEHDDGKIFTIYIGSRQKTEELASKLSNDLRPHLAKPVHHNEIEFATGVIGRFCAAFRGGEFRKYGTSGMDTLRSAFDEHIGVLMMPPSRAKYKETLRELERKSFKRLNELYDTYFIG